MAFKPDGHRVATTGLNHNLAFTCGRAIAAAIDPAQNQPPTALVTHLELRFEPLAALDGPQVGFRRLYGCDRRQRYVGRPAESLQRSEVYMR